jgi:hypothetical protein
MWCLEVRFRKWTNISCSTAFISAMGTTAPSSVVTTRSFCDVKAALDAKVTHLPAFGAEVKDVWNYKSLHHAFVSWGLFRKRDKFIFFRVVLDCIYLRVFIHSTLRVTCQNIAFINLTLFAFFVHKFSFT